MFRPYKNYLCEILTAIVCNFSRIFRLVAMTMIKAALYLSSHNINIILAINVFLQCSPYFILSFFPSRLILYFVTLQAPSDVHLVHQDEIQIIIALSISPVIMAGPRCIYSWYQIYQRATLGWSWWNGTASSSDDLDSEFELRSIPSNTSSNPQMPWGCPWC